MNAMQHGTIDIDAVDVVGLGLKQKHKQHTTACTARTSHGRALCRGAPTVVNGGATDHLSARINRGRAMSHGAPADKAGGATEM